MYFFYRNGIMCWFIHCFTLNIFVHFLNYVQFPYSFLITSFFKDFVYIFLERGEGRQRKREKHNFGCLLHIPQLGLAHNPGMCPDWESDLWPLLCRPALHQLSHVGQGSENIILMSVWYFMGRTYPSLKFPCWKMLGFLWIFK